MLPSEKITHGLNPRQRAAVTSLDGPLLILAGAGSGKTRVLTHRVALLIAEGKASAEEILAVTFTNKAAREMEHRITRLLSEMGQQIIEPLWISTFHSFCCRLLRNHADLLEYQRHFGIYDSADQISMIKKVMENLGIAEKVYPAKGFQGRINNAKTQGLNPGDIEKKSSHLMDDKSLEVYKHYEVEMKKSNAMDFGDLLLKTYELFRHYPDLLALYQQKFKYIMVDEYQDTNHIQYLIVHMLAGKHHNLCVVGDEDQSIYSWRGADIGNILSFEKDFPNAEVVKLEENYRSSGTIVNAATEMIRNNTERKEKTLFTSNPDGDKILIREETNEYDEARFLAKTVLKLATEEQAAFNDIAVFYRTNAQSRVLEEQLRSHSIPYRLIGGVKFYDRLEIKDVMSYMRLAVNPTDDVALKRIINVPTRGIGKSSIDKIQALAFERGVSLYEVLPLAVEQRLLHSGLTSKVRRFHQLISSLIEKATQLPLHEFYHVLLDQTGYVQTLKKENTPEADARIENLEELDNALSQFSQERGEEGSLQAFLEEIALVSDVDSLDEEAQSVTLMTLHISKGLEYPYVFIVGMEEGLFPSGRAIDSGLDNSALEEERRLAYVGMTRAMKRLFLTYARTRRVWGSEQMNPPCRFLKEIPDKYLSFETGVMRPRFMQGFASGSATKPAASEKSGRWADYEAQDFPDYDMDTTPTGGQFAKGMRVRHPTFGAGSIYSVDGQGVDQKVSVLFADKSIKKFVVKYARLERI